VRDGLARITHKGKQWPVGDPSYNAQNYVLR
jgi:hypothetical protein